MRWRSAIPGNLLTVIDRRNICAAEQIRYGYVPRRFSSPTPPIIEGKGLATPD